jgi:hypothetical protein
VSEQIFFVLPEAFPIEDVLAIGKTLTDSEVLVPGYIPPNVGLLAMDALFFSKDLQGITTTILPDCNLASRMARIARFGLPESTDFPTTVAVNLMAFAQATDIQIEPSVAFHELAHRFGNAACHDELVWFRAADRGDPSTWIDLACGRRTHLEDAPLTQPGTEDLAKPLKRWTRNYVVALKVAELELKPVNHLERAMQLFDWMFNEFILAGPAGLFASMYFAPHAARKGLVKHLRSRNRSRAIEGVKNAAWDITHLSEFVRRVEEGQPNGQQYIFATADKNLAKIAPLLLLGDDLPGARRELAHALQGWWPPSDAKALAERFIEYVERVDHGTRPPRVAPSLDFMSRLISEGEARLRSWHPGSAA